MTPAQREALVIVLAHYGDDPRMQPLRELAQEPLICPEDGGQCGAGGYCRPQRKPLRDAQIVGSLAWDDYLGGCITLLAFARAIEAAHGIGETP